MYEAFDKFLAMQNWHTTHPLDAQYFYRALDQVVRDKVFNPEKMAEYMANKLRISRDDESDFADAIRRYTKNAGVVQDFLKATSGGQ